MDFNTYIVFTNKQTVNLHSIMQVFTSIFLYPKNKFYLLLLLVFWVGKCSVFAQKQQIDSLQHILNTQKLNDTTHIQTLADLAVLMSTNNPDSSLWIGKNVIERSQKLNYSAGLARGLHIEGLFHYQKGDYDQSFAIYERAFIHAQKANNQLCMGNIRMGQGNIFYMKGSYKEALTYYEKAQLLMEKTKDLVGLAKVCNNTALILHEEGNYFEALNYYFRAIKAFEENGYAKGVSRAYSNIALILKDQGDFEKSLQYHLKSLAIKQKIEDNQGMASSYENIGYLNYLQKKYEIALEYYFKAITIHESLDYKYGLTFSYFYVAEVYIATQHMEEAQRYLDKALDKAYTIQSAERIGQIKAVYAKFFNANKQYLKAILLAKEAFDAAQKIGSLEYSRDALEQKYIAEKHLGMEKEALKSYELFVSLKDSIYNDKNKKNILNKEFEYKAEQSKAEQEKKNLRYQAEIHEHKIIRNGVIVISLLLVSLLLVGYRSYSLIQKQKEKIEEQTSVLQKANKALEAAYTEVNLQKDIIEKHHRDFMGSLNAAKRIQDAILPSITKLNQHLGAENYFVMYRPKDVVSGDFYFFEESNQRQILIMADCTGHGVPGAFVSMIGHDLLSDIIKFQKIVNPEMILEALQNGIQRVLRQHEREGKEGMDLVVLTINHQAKKAYYSGAMNPIFYIQHQQLYEIKPTKIPIGGIFKEYNRNSKYQVHEISLESDTVFYLCSDGFQDQFGGEQDKKFMVKKLKETFLNIHHHAMPEQKNILEQTFENWKGKQNQIDDVSVWGIKIRCSSCV